MTIWRHRVAVRFLPIIFDKNELETWSWCHSVRLVKAHRLIGNMTYVTLTWRDLRSNFKIDLSRIKRIWIDPAWREEHDGVKLVPLAYVVQKIFMKKHYPQKTICLSLVTSRTYSIRLIANLRAQIDSGDPGLSCGCLTILLTSMVIEIIAIFCENSPILRKNDPLTSNLTWSKNDLSIFCRTCHGLSNAVYRLSLYFLVSRMICNIT